MGCPCSRIYCCCYCSCRVRRFAFYHIIMPAYIHLPLSLFAHLQGLSPDFTLLGSWFLHSLAISTFYATVITTGGKLLPRRLHADAFAIISSVGQIGSALFPLLVGLLSAQKGVGIWIVEPSVVALLGAQGACWWFVPRVERIQRVE